MHPQSAHITKLTVLLTVLLGALAAVPVACATGSTSVRGSDDDDEEETNDPTTGPTGSKAASTSASGGSSGGGAGSSSSSSSSSKSASVGQQASSSGGGAGCDGTGVCKTCQDCALDVGGGCENEAAACANSPDCLDFIDCIDPCSSSDAACFDNCEKSHPTGAGIYSELAYCAICVACYNDCNGASAGC